MRNNNTIVIYVINFIILLRIFYVHIFVLFFLTLFYFYFIFIYFLLLLIYRCQLIEKIQKFEIIEK